MRKVACLIIPLLLALGGRPRAQDGALLLIDTGYVHGAEAVTRPEAAFSLPGNTPADWTAPTDYAHGVVWLRIQVSEKPAQTALRLQPCLEQAAAQGGMRSCAPAQMFSDTGTYAWSVPLSQWAPALSWAARPARILVILQDAYGVPVDPGGTGWAGNPYASLYYPMKARFSAAVVSAGGAFPGWDALLTTAVRARNGAGPGFSIRAVGEGAVEIFFSPARPIDAEARCWDSRGKLLARATLRSGRSAGSGRSLRSGPGTASYILPLAPGSADGPVWVELRAGPERWASGLGLRP